MNHYKLETADTFQGSAALPFVIPSEAEGSTVVRTRPGMESVFCPAAIFHGSVALPFVIPSEAEGSAVLRTRPGNVFLLKQTGFPWCAGPCSRESIALYNDLRLYLFGRLFCAGVFLASMLSDRLGAARSSN